MRFLSLTRQPDRLSVIVNKKTYAVHSITDRLIYFLVSIIIFSTASRIRLENCLLLQKNFAACIEASQTNSDPGERQRPNSLDDIIPAEPGTRHLGYLVRDMANSLRTWSFQLQHLSDQLIRDDPLPDKQSTEYKKTRRLIQVFKMIF